MDGAIDKESMVPIETPGRVIRQDKADEPIINTAETREYSSFANQLAIIPNPARK
jgi:hypothetical protein